MARSADDPARDRSLTVDELLEELEGASASHGGDAGLQEEIIEQLKQTGTLGDERITATLAEILDNIESSIDPDPAIAAAGGLRTLGGALLVCDSCLTRFPAPLSLLLCSRGGPVARGRRG